MGLPDRSRPDYYTLFETPIGPCGIAWRDRGLTRLQLPEGDRRATEGRLNGGGGTACPWDGALPPTIRHVIGCIEQYLGGHNVDFASVPLDLADVPPFHRRVYDAARAIGWGQTASYGELARRAGSPAAARAVGQALARNPIAIIIPCHRILASGRRIGGFSAFGGTSTKEALLALEGVPIPPRSGAGPPPDPIQEARAQVQVRGGRHPSDRSPANPSRSRS